MDPEFAAALTTAKRSHDVTGSIQDIRKMIATAKMEYFQRIKPWKGTSEDITIPTRDGNSNSVRVYRPSTCSDGFTLPLVVWYHGGGFCLGDLDSDDSFCRRVAEEVKCLVVNVDYRLAPEHPFPIPINDCWDAFQWAYSNAASLGADITKGFIIGGGSAGANAASVVAHIALDHQIPITGVHLGVPFLIHPDNVPEQYRAKWKSLEENKDAPMLSRESVNMLLQAYNPAPDNPLFSSLFWPSGHKAFPPTHFQVCGLDPVRDDRFIFEEVLRTECNVRTKLDFYPGVPHAFNAGFPDLEFSKKFVNDAVAGFSWLLANKQ